MELVSTKEEIAANLLVFDSYRTSKNAKHRAYFGERLRLGKIFVFGIVGERYIFSPSRFVGYSKCTAEKHEAFPGKNGSITTPKLSQLLGKPTENNKAEKAYISLCHEIGIAPSYKGRTYWKFDISNSPSDFTAKSGESGFPDEVAQYIEGATKRVCVNAYERNDKAREACLSHHGLNCAVCEFNFEARYGTLGKGFMHVHHLLPISSRGVAYIVHPVDDLRPVCPNCHAMLHKSDPPFSIEELKTLCR